MSNSFPGSAWERTGQEAPASRLPPPVPGSILFGAMFFVL